MTIGELLIISEKSDRHEPALTHVKFTEMLDQAFPKRGDTLKLPFMADPTSS